MFWLNSATERKRETIIYVLLTASFVVFQACTLARRTAESFLKYVHRNVHTLGMQVTCSPESQVKGTNSTLTRKNTHSQSAYFYIYVQKGSDTSKGFGPLHLMLFTVITRNWKLTLSLTP